MLRDSEHRLAWLVLRYRSASDGKEARFAWDARLLREGILDHHSIRHASGRLAELPDGVFAKDSDPGLIDGVTSLLLTRR